MSYGAYTPESLLLRSDSKNPATTCRGLTSNGQQCRRTLAQSPRVSPTTSPPGHLGVLAISQTTQAQNAAAFYCWQHKEQAVQRVLAESRTGLMPLKERTSIDTLVERIGVMHLDEDATTVDSRRHRPRQRREPPMKKRDTLPAGWHDMQSPLMTVPEDLLEPQSSRVPRMGRSNTRASFLCCLRTDDDDLPPVRKRPRQHILHPSQQHSLSRKPHHQQYLQQTYDRPNMASIIPALTLPRSDPGCQPSAPLLRQKLPPHGDRRTTTQIPTSHSQDAGSDVTRALLSLIPADHSPTTTSQLLAELSKPISPADEAGYIYVFWLTPESDASRPDDETASSLLDDDEPTGHRQRRDDAIQRYASRRKTSSAQPQRTILLKIGRAANVHRRLSQWIRQCGQKITLVRYYPYIPSTGTPVASWTPHKVPHVHRVERLIHLEMAEKRVHGGTCKACGREHKEWFEIQATRKALRAVDECVRRWVGWAERRETAA